MIAFAHGIRAQGETATSLVTCLLPAVESSPLLIVPAARSIPISIVPRDYRQLVAIPSSLLFFFSSRNQSKLHGFKLLFTNF